MNRDRENENRKHSAKTAEEGERKREREREEGEETTTRSFWRLFLLGEFFLYYALRISHRQFLELTNLKKICLHSRRVRTTQCLIIVLLHALTRSAWQTELLSWPTYGFVGKQNCYWHLFVVQCNSNESSQVSESLIHATVVWLRRDVQSWKRTTSGETIGHERNRRNQSDSIATD